MSSCKNCGYWENGDCHLPDWVGRWEPVKQDAMVIYADAHDDSGLDAGVRTGPLFGCKGFKRRLGNDVYGMREVSGGFQVYKQTLPPFRFDRRSAKTTAVTVQRHVALFERKEDAEEYLFMKN
jgi:hypothetical protein